MLIGRMSMTKVRLDDWDIHDLILCGRPIPVEYRDDIRYLNFDAQATTEPMFGATHDNTRWLTDIQPLIGLGNLEDLWICTENEVNNIPLLTKFPKLVELKLNTGVADLSPISALEELTYLHLVTKSNNLRPLGQLTGLRELYLNCLSAKDLYPLENLLNLKDLSIEADADDLRPLGMLKNLTELFLSVREEVDFSPLSSLKSLTNLSVEGAKEDLLEPIAEIPRLRNLWIYFAPSLSDLSPLRSLAELEHLTLSSTAVSNLSGLSNLPKLASIEIVDGPIMDISCLIELPALSQIRLQRTAIIDLKPFTQCHSLKKIVADTHSLNDEALETLEQPEYSHFSVSTWL